MSPSGLGAILFQPPSAGLHEDPSCCEHQDWRVWTSSTYVDINDQHRDRRTCSNLISDIVRGPQGITWVAGQAGLVTCDEYHAQNGSCCTKRQGEVKRTDSDIDVRNLNQQNWRGRVEG